MKNESEELYDYKQLLSKAVYIINQLEIGFIQAEQLLSKSFTRVKPNEPTDMVRLFLPDYLHKDSHKFIIEYEKFKKRN